MTGFRRGRGDAVAGRLRVGACAGAERGASIVELAVALPLLVLIVVGAIDFARVFYAALEVTAAARAGAQYGARNFANSDPTSGGMTTAATHAAVDISLNTVTAGRSCECVGNTNVSSRTSASCTSDCSGVPNTHLVISVTVTAVKAFTTVAFYPGIPHTLTITRGATMRVK